MQAIGDRIKRNYEGPSRHYLTRRVPVIIRVDGKAFHTFTRHMKKPFDDAFIECMDVAATDLFDEIQGCKAAYVQSDEASFLLTDYDTTETEAWFGYCQNKLESVAASIMTAKFNRAMAHKKGICSASFDARAFNIPREEVCNYFLWRMKDWERNSLSMYCRSFFSDKEMHGHGKADQHEMLHNIGKNWVKDCTDRERNGRWIFAESSKLARLRGTVAGWYSNIEPTYEQISEVLDDLIYCDKVGG